MSLIRICLSLRSRFSNLLGRFLAQGSQVGVAAAVTAITAADAA
jgi:hypothetical protein